MENQHGFNHPCPHCGAIDATSGPISKGIFHWVVKTFTLHSVLDFMRCKICAGNSYTVSLAMIENRNVSEELSRRYFWSKASDRGRSAEAILKPRRKIRGLPDEWRIAAIETPEGVLQWHFLGPFKDETDPGVWTGDGEQDGPWNHAAAISLRLFRKLLSAESSGIPGDESLCVKPTGGVALRKAPAAVSGSRR